jgi:hypothetical protein
MGKRIGRDAGTGKYVPLDYARKHPGTTTTEPQGNPKKK